MPDIDNAPVEEYGHGVTMAHIPGLPDDPAEEAPELRWPQSIAVYDRMRRTDAAVASVLRAVNLATGRLSFRIDPNGARDEVVAMIAEDFDLPILGDDTERRRTRTRDRFQFGDHRRMAYLSLIYGHMPFEQVGRIVEDDRVDGGLAWRLRKLAPRMPATVSAINVARDGGLVSIEQYPAGMTDRNRQTQRELGFSGGIEIPVDRLVMYVHERESGAWQGQSILRPAYKHWLLKDRALRVMAQIADRNGMGVPFVEAPDGATEDQIKGYYTEMARRFRSGATAGAAGPKGTKLSLVGVNGSLPDIVAQVEYHDSQIAQNVLAQFLRLGVTATGSRALGETFVDFFAAAIDAMAADFASTFTAHVIEDYVDLNFGEEEPAPAVTAAPADEKQVLTPEELQTLADIGAIDATDPEMRGYVRERYGLPDPADDAPSAPGPAVAARAADARNERITVQPHRPHIPHRPATTTATAERTPGGIEPVTARSLVAGAARTARAVTRPVRNRLIRAATPLPYPGAWRTLAAYEEEAGFDPQELMDEQEAALAALIAAFAAVRDAWRADIVEQVAASDGLDALLGMDVPRGEGAATIEAAMADMAAVGVEQAAREAARQGVSLSAEPPGPATFGERSYAVEGMLAVGLMQSARNRAATEGGTGRWAAATVADAVDDHLATLRGVYERDQLGGALIDGQNAGRLTAMESGPEPTFYASEILDRNVCDACAAVDGTEYATRDEAEFDYPAGTFRDCYGGPRCRGTLVAVYTV